MNRYSGVDNALHRVVYEQNANTTPIWEEGQPFPGTLNEDQRNIVLGSGEAYYFFLNAFGRDSYDAGGCLHAHGEQRPDDQLPERQLERRDHELLQRCYRRRRRRARVGPRLHAVHVRPDLPVAVGGAERGVLGYLG